jgi:hypothetical protein
VIHGLPTDLEAGDVYEDDGNGLGKRVGGVPRLAATARGEGPQRPAVP